MKTSLEWLNTYLDRPTDADEADEVMTAVGFPLEESEQVIDGDELMDFEVTSNRPDCLSHVGVAREVAAATGRALKAPEFELPAAGNQNVTDLTSVDNQAADACPLYTARVITGVKVGPSPQWLARRIESIGLRPVNNVVDVTNFVLHEMGQPLHAFDMGLLAERRIVVRHAADGETFTAIDGSQHKLKKHMLVIADAQRPVAVAGVMGGKDSEVGDSTTDILLESAEFDPLSVRTTSRALKLASDSSFRFERGVDRLGVDRASRRAAQLIIETAGGTLADGVIAAGDDPAASSPPTVEMSLERCNRLLGIELDADTVERHLAALELTPNQTSPGVFACTIPSHRLDLYREVDLIEEISRLHGFDNIPVHQKVHLVTTAPQDSVESRRRIGQVLISHGYCETISFSFLPPNQAEAFAAGLTIVRVDEEKKKAEPALRPSLLPSLLACRKSNQDAGNKDVRLFEVAQIFGQNDSGYVQDRRLALLADAPDATAALRQVRGSLEELAELLGTGGLTVRAADNAPAWASDAAEVLIDGNVIGAYGIANKKTLSLFDLQTPVVLCELDYPSLTAAYPPQPRVRALPRFPAIDRDLSIVVDEAAAWATIDQTVRDVDPALLEGVGFVTVYRGKPIAKGKKSVTLRMRFRDPERTLQHDEVTEQVNAVIAALTQKLGAELRDN